jgi:hypothetical protein
LLARNSASSGDLSTRGRLAVSGLSIAGESAKMVGLTTRQIDLPFDEIRLPGLLGSQGSQRAPILVRLGAVRIDAPSAQLTRSSSGMVLPELGSGSKTPAAAQPVAAAPAPQGLSLSVNSLQISNGSVAFTDRTMQPFFSSAINSLNVDLKGLRFPNPEIKSARIDASTAPQGTLQISGSLNDSGGSIDVGGEQIALAPFNPYVRAYSPYSVSDGSLSVAAKTSVEGRRYATETKITLHDFDVGGNEGESLFEEQFGVPLTVALALLRDLQGDIVLNVPVAVDDQGAKIDVLSIARGALQAAVVNALTSPLKLAGAVFQSGKVKALAPPALLFRPGRSELTEDSAQQLSQLAALLASRPGMAVTIDTAASKHDGRWLREQALFDELNQPQGIFGRLSNLGQGDMRDAIRRALEARRNDQQGSLAAEQEATLERWLDERPPLSAERLRELSRTRLTRLQAILLEEHGIGAERVDATRFTAG